MQVDRPSPMPFILIAIGVILAIAGAIVAIAGAADPIEPPQTATLTFRQVLAIDDAQAPGNRPDVTRDDAEDVVDEEVTFPGRPTQQGLFTYTLAPATLTGDEVIDGSVSAGPSGQGWAINLTLDDAGSDSWQQLTADLACLRDQGQQVTSQVAVALGKIVQATGGFGTPGAGGVECEQGIVSGRMTFPVDTEAMGEQILAAAGIEVGSDEEDGGGVAIPLIVAGIAFVVFGLVTFARDRRPAVRR
jgi:hypothetical protein